MATIDANRFLFFFQGIFSCLTYLLEIFFSDLMDKAMGAAWVSLQT